MKKLLLFVALFVATCNAAILNWHAEMTGPVGSGTFEASWDGVSSNIQGEFNWTDVTDIQWLSLESLSSSWATSWGTFTSFPVTGTYSVQLPAVTYVPLWQNQPWLASLKDVDKDYLVAGYLYDGSLPDGNVPESTWFPAVAGLGLLGFVLRRRLNVLGLLAVCFVGAGTLKAATPPIDGGGSVTVTQKESYTLNRIVLRYEIRYRYNYQINGTEIRAQPTTDKVVAIICTPVAFKNTRDQLVIDYSKTEELDVTDYVVAQSLYQAAYSAVPGIALNKPAVLLPASGSLALLLARAAK